MKNRCSSKNLRFAILLIVAFCLNNSGKAQIISTFAGDGYGGYSGDGGAATAARIRGSIGLTVDGIGNVYIVDNLNNVIRKVDVSGVITTIAGSGTAGYSGDGGAATLAKLDTPSSVAIDVAGNIFISDMKNNCIRKVNTSGIISTVAGNGTAGYSGDSGPATAATLRLPRQIAMSTAGYLYIVDNNNNCIRVVNPAGTINTFAGTGTFGYSGDGGPATAASLGAPYGVALDASGNVYIGDQLNHRIRVVNTSLTINTFAGNGSYGYSGDGGPASAAKFNSPGCVSVDAAGNLYIADVGNSVIRKVSTGGTITTIAGDGSTGFSGDGGPATAAKLNHAYDMKHDASGNVYIADNSSARVRKVSTCLTVVGAITGPDSVCAGNTIALADTTSGGVWSSAASGIATVSSSGIASGLSVGTAIISYVVANSCGTAYRTKIIHVLPLPTAGAITGKDSVCVGATITMVDTTTSGAWSSSNTSLATVSAGIVTGVAPGTLNIRYIVNNSCGSDTATHPITVLSYAFCHAGVLAGQERTLGISISPNPVRASLNIVAEIPLRAVIITVDGRKVLDEQNAKTINLSSFINGMYMLLLFDKDGVMVRNEKVVKE